MVYICNLFKTLSGKSISNESPSHIFIFMHKSFKFARTSAKQLLLHQITAFLDLSQHTLTAATLKHNV